MMEEPNCLQELNQPPNWKNVTDKSKGSSHEDTNKNVSTEVR
jgi:hypothetical protein